MCLLAVAWRHHRRFPLLLIGNRDEFHSRPAAPLAIDARTAVIGGRDLDAGGRWLALRGGRLAAVTNVRRGIAVPTAARSRGALVEAFVGGQMTAAEYTLAMQQQAADFGPFNLLLFDGQQMNYLGNVPAGHACDVAAGLHTLSNAALDTPWPKSRRAGSLLETALGDLDDAPSAAWLHGLLDGLGDRRPAADDELPDTGIGRERERLLSPPFIRLPGYGTRCSSVVAVRDDGAWWFSERRFDAAGDVAGETALSGAG